MCRVPRSEKCRKGHGTSLNIPENHVTIQSYLYIDLQLHHHYLYLLSYMWIIESKEKRIKKSDKNEREQNRM